jgi:pimeloyl-ACP methyl ester carboxylesterase/DNA-binding CsgD family transcriptional regulator
MTPFRQEIRFANTADGLRLAYAVSGHGYPLLRGPTWMSNVELDWQTSILGPIFRELSARYTLYRYNPRGYGLSEGEGTGSSLESCIADMEAVVDAARLQRFALWGQTAAGSMTSIAYAARHPERVSHMVLSVPAAQGEMRRSNATPEEKERWLAFVKLIELGWGESNPAFRQMFTTRLFPGATSAHMAEVSEMLRVSTSPRHAAKMVRGAGETDVSQLLREISCPTLVLHCRACPRAPLEQARLIASSIRNARYVPLDSENYLPLASEPAFARLIEEIEAFLPPLREVSPKDAALAELTRREREVLALLARGLDNNAIASQLALSEKTVRNTVSHIFDKLAVASRAEAIVLARRAGLGD